MKETVDFSVLIESAKGGDNAAFEKLYHLTIKTSYHTASLLLNNSCDVDDVLQNSYFKAYQKLPELKKPESFDYWIKTIVENECKNYIKKEKRISAPIVFLKSQEEISEEWKQPVPQEYMEREELRQSISDILNNLSPEVRACIILYHYDDKSLNEIKDILDIPLGTVKSRLHNGRKEIEKQFAKLRKKDPTLYSIGAIPAVLSLLAFQAKNIVVPAAIAEASITSAVTAAASGTTAAATGAGAGAAGAASGSAAVSAGAGSASVSAAGAVSTAAASIGVKAAAIAVAGSVAVGGSAAIKNYVENRSADGTPAAYSSSAEYEETCTVAETLTEFISAVIPSAVISTLSEATEKTALPSKEQTEAPITAIQTSTVSASKRQSSTKRISTTAQTSKLTTAAKTTATKPTTTSKTTTSTTQRATEKPTSTVPPTTNPENNFGASGGVVTEYKGNDARVVIPASVGSSAVTAIGAGAFSGNTSIKSVSIPSSVTQIGQEAFADCTSLSSVSLPSSLKKIGIGAFYGCTSLTSVAIPDGTQTISDEAFAQCASLQTVTIPASVTSIADDAFSGCGSVTIRCKEGSAAHDFAVANSINYSLI